MNHKKNIKLCDNYSRIVSEAIYKTKEGLKFLTPKQILQRFQQHSHKKKQVTHLKICKLLKSDKSFILCIEKKKLLKVYNNIMNLIKV